MPLPLALALPALIASPARIATSVFSWGARNWKVIVFGLAASFIVFLGIRTLGWFRDNAVEHARKDTVISDQSAVIASKDAAIATLNSEVREASADLLSAKEQFDAILAEVQKDNQALDASRRIEARRAQKFGQIVEDLRNAHPGESPVADPVLVDATRRVRLQLRPRLPDASDRMANSGGDGLQAG